MKNKIKETENTSKVNSIVNPTISVVDPTTLVNDNKVEYPNIILDLTDEEKTLTEAIAECEKNRKLLTPWYKRILKRAKHIFYFKK